MFIVFHPLILQRKLRLSVWSRLGQIWTHPSAMRAPHTPALRRRATTLSPARSEARQECLKAT